VSQLTESTIVVGGIMYIVGYRHNGNSRHENDD